MRTLGRLIGALAKVFIGLLVLVGGIVVLSIGAMGGVFVLIGAVVLYVLLVGVFIAGTRRR